MIEYVLALGTNLGNKLLNLKQAINKLNPYFEKDIKLSSVYLSKALLPPSQFESSWDKPFLNLLISGYSSLQAYDLLHRVKLIEKEMGRDLSAPRWSPRIIDIDIILAGDKGQQIINLKPNHNLELAIPHSELGNRAFWLLPLKEIYQEWQHPITKIFLKEYIKMLSEESLLNTKVIYKNLY